MSIAAFSHGRSESNRTVSRAVVLSFMMVACGGTLDAGWNEPRGRLSVDDRNPIVLCNDSSKDNWQGEYALLLANSGGPKLAGIIVNDSWAWPDLDENLAAWQNMVAAAREAGLRDVPSPIGSTGPVLVRPTDEEIDSTQPNRSEGARFILEAAERWSLPELPLVVVTGGRPTDVADAYLMDPTLPERVVVVSSLGSVTEAGGEMGVPNGEMDPWADVIVAQKFRYIQVSAFYRQKGDVPDSLLTQLPDNAFSSWVKSKQPDIWEALVAADQVGVLAAGVPGFVSAVTPVVQKGQGPEGFPGLSIDSAGPATLVTEVSAAVAAERMRQMLLDPATFAPE